MIGKKDHASWSMRPGVLMRHFGIPFDEVRLRPDFAPGSAFDVEPARDTPAGQVPVLVDDGFAARETPAIVETLPEHDVLDVEAPCRTSRDG